jgi:hypothetical protein
MASKKTAQCPIQNREAERGRGVETVSAVAKTVIYRCEKRSRFAAISKL